MSYMVRVKESRLSLDETLVDSKTLKQILILYSLIFT